VYRRVLVAIDASTVSRRALDQAIGLARAHRAKLRILHVIDELTIGTRHPSSLAEFRQMALAAGTRTLEQARARAAAAGVRAEVELYEIRDIGSLVRHVPEVIVRKAARWKADLLVVGSHGRRGISRLLLGSVAQAVMLAASVPVLLVKGARR
jgi:nucleotide-binding universal stress UspA family protein